MKDVYVQKDSQILIWRVKKVMLKTFEKKYNVLSCLRFLYFNQHISTSEVILQHIRSK